MAAHVPAPPSPAAAAAEVTQPRVAEVEHRTPTVELYGDVLHHLFGFLQMKDFVSTARTHKRWMAVAVQMRSRADCVTIDVSRPMMVDSLLVSPLRLHVTSLHLSGMVFLSSLSSIARALPHLRSFDAGTIVLPTADAEVRFPSRLTQLRLEVKRPPPTTANETVALLFGALGQRIAHQLPQLEALAITIDRIEAQVLPTESFYHPLVALPALTSLTSSGIPLGAIDTIRRMAHLHQLNCRAFRLQHFERLVSSEVDAPIPPLEMSPLGPLSPNIDERVASLLLRLPTLTAVRGIFLLADVGPLLRGLPNLRDLLVHTLQGTIVQVDSLVAGVQECRHLTCLHLQHPKVADAHLVEILSALPALTELSVVCGPTVTELTFLNRVPGLTKLILFGDQRIDSSAACHLAGLPALTFLCLRGVFSSPLDPAAVARMTPGSASFDSKTWPRLKHFLLQLDEGPCARRPRV